MMYVYAAPIERASMFALGLGDMTRAQLAQTTGATVGAAIMALSPATGPAAPFVALAGALVSGLTTLFAGMFSGCGPTCDRAAHVVDQVEAQYLKPNLEAYFALPAPRPKSAQTAALQVFDYAWSMVLQGCGDPALGDAGRRCISERKAGGTVPGTNGNWFVWYRDPIANDPEVAPDSPLNSFVSGAESGSLLPLLAIGLVAWGVIAAL